MRHGGKSGMQQMFGLRLPADRSWAMFALRGFFAGAFRAAILRSTGPKRGPSMTREERAQFLSEIRQSDPVLLIATYRAATNTPPMDQLPRGLGFTGMIEAILACESVTGEYGKLADTVPLHPVSVVQPNRRTPWGELRAFCSGAALVCTGLLMAAVYFLVKGQLLA
jgi:hypothetical protein